MAFGLRPAPDSALPTAARVEETAWTRLSASSATGARLPMTAGAPTRWPEVSCPANPRDLHSWRAPPGRPVGALSVRCGGLGGGLQLSRHRRRGGSPRVEHSHHHYEVATRDLVANSIQGHGPLHNRYGFHLPSSARPAYGNSSSVRSDSRTRQRVSAGSDSTSSSSADRPAREQRGRRATRSRREA